MINLYIFNVHKTESRAQLVWDYGTYIALRYDEGKKITLYHMGEFFAEVWYGPMDNEITLVRGFKTNALLAPYAEQVDFPEIL